MRPTGAAKKEQDRRTLKIRAIPTDESLQFWLDRLEGLDQWVFALIATYGLRPSEAWHAEKIDADGWLTIPGEGLTKTDRHFAPPVPAEWLDRYQLRENFKSYQVELRQRWPLKWEERGGLRIPTNNSEVSNALYNKLRDEAIDRLWVDDEWVRPYDLRHSYAIRCETSTDPDLLSTPAQDFAKWMGHTEEVHKRTYLKFMSRDRELESMKFRVGSAEAPAGLSEEVLAKLAKLEQLEKLMAS